MALRFTWDPRKAAANERRHGVSFHEATTVFDDSLSVTIHDPDHSLDEERHLLVGMSKDQRLLVVAHAEQGDTVRLISARRANRRERQAYEEEEG